MDGFFEFVANQEGSNSNGSESDTNLAVVSPNALELKDSPSCVVMVPSDALGAKMDRSKKIVQLKVTIYPCQLVLQGISNT